MRVYSIDILYACALIGLDAGASLREIETALADILAYRFADSVRIACVREMVDFFAAREQFAAYDSDFTEIKKAYRQRAMELHPDRNPDAQAEETLKTLNAAYALIEDVHRRARDYYRQDEKLRQQSEREARKAAAREKRVQEPQAPPSSAGARTKMRAETSAPPQNKGGKAGKYMAASVPRSIRTARLGYLPVQTIIGTKSVVLHDGTHYIMDVIMLPQDQFLRAKSYLATPEIALPALQYGKFAPAYTPRDIQEFTVPENTENPEAAARDHFIKAFGL